MRNFGGANPSFPSFPGSQNIPGSGTEHFWGISRQIEGQKFPNLLGKNSHTAQLAQGSEGSSGISWEYPPKASILGIKAPRLRLERRFGIPGSPGSFPLSGIPAWLSRSRLFQGFFFGITAKFNLQWCLLLGAFPGI